jgi:predicted RNase H-like nuclease
MAVLGIDGCPGGWVGAHLTGDGVTWHAGSFCELLELQADVVAVDIPIGLPAGARRRAADVEARAALGRQRSSVFFAPPRVVLEAVDQPDATRLSRAAGSTGVSIQMFYVLGKVAEVDDALRADPGAAARVVEAHPEVSFRRLARTDVLPPKRTVAGREARLDVLRRWLPGAALPAPLPGRAQPDDCLDALVCAWTALRWSRGEADVLGGELDGLGVPMRIVV